MMPVNATKSHSASTKLTITTMTPHIQSFYDLHTGTITHLVYDDIKGHAAIIDPVLDYDPKSGRTSTGNADHLITAVKELHLQVDWIIETHAHADHISSAQYLRQQVGGKIAIGAHINQVQSVFKNLFHLEADFAVDGTQFDHLFQDKEEFQIGRFTATAIAVPGHTPADMAYQVGDAIFVGDTLFMPDVGTARCDFPGGDAHQLYHSIQQLLSYPGHTRLYLCHDYPPDERDMSSHTSVAAQKKGNIHIKDGISEEQFVAMRTQRDASLAMPVLILPAVQMNIRAGLPPPPEENGVSYLKIPLNLL